MITFKIDDSVMDQHFDIIQEVLLSLNINYQETMTVDENLYHRYIELVSQQIENYGRISEIKSKIFIDGIVMKQPPKPTIKDLLLNIQSEQRSQRELISEIQFEQKTQRELITEIQLELQDQRRLISEIQIEQQIQKQQIVEIQLELKDQRRLITEIQIEQQIQKQQISEIQLEQKAQRDLISEMKKEITQIVVRLNKVEDILERNNLH